MKVAFLGLKGLPPKFGGLQFDAEEIGRRLAVKGHDVSVYCRRWYTGSVRTHQGMRLVVTPTIPWRWTDAVVHGFTSTIDALARRYNVVHFYAYGSYFFVPLFKLFGVRTVIRLNGVPWDNISYNRLAQSVQKLAVSIGIRYADAVTAESLPLKERFEEEYDVQIVVTPVGANVRRRLRPSLITGKYGLKGGDYLLFLGRLERGKRADWIIRAFKEFEHPGLKLVIAGDTKDAAYRGEVESLASGDPRIMLTGYVNGRLKEELVSNCRVFILPSVSEGMPTSIMEAMGYGRCCLVSDIAPHRWLFEEQGSGYLFDVHDYGDFTARLAEVTALGDVEVSKVGSRARKSVGRRFDWDSIVEDIEKVYEGASEAQG